MKKQILYVSGSFHLPLPPFFKFHSLYFIKIWYPFSLLLKVQHIKKLKHSKSKYRIELGNMLYNKFLIETLYEKNNGNEKKVQSITEIDYRAMNILLKWGRFQDILSVKNGKNKRVDIWHTVRYYYSFLLHHLFSYFFSFVNTNLDLLFAVFIFFLCRYLQRSKKISCIYKKWDLMLYSTELIPHFWQKKKRKKKRKQRNTNFILFEKVLLLARVGIFFFEHLFLKRKEKPDNVRWYKYLSSSFSFS